MKNNVSLIAIGLCFCGMAICIFGFLQESKTIVLWSLLCIWFGILLFWFQSFYSSPSLKTVKDFKEGEEFFLYSNLGNNYYLVYFSDPKLYYFVKFNKEELKNDMIVNEKYFVKDGKVYKT